MTKPKRYVAKSTGKSWNTKEEAIKDNARYKNDVAYRMSVKRDNYGNVNPTVSYPIPFIKSKKRTLTNAGLATGAVISENMLDSIAKYANAVGLPIKTALGLAVKETTLGNWTDDATFGKLFKKGSFNRIHYTNMYNANGVKQHINPGVAIDERELVNLHDERNPYREAEEYADKASVKGIPDKAWSDGTDLALAHNKYIDYLTKGEAYADRQAEVIKNTPKTHVLEAAFSKFKNNPNSYNPGQPNYAELVNKRAEEVWSSPEIQEWNRRRLENAGRRDSNKYGGIHIAPSKKGTFTAAATKHGMGVQEFAARVLRNKSNYSPSLVKKANFARNASKWNH